MPAPLIAGLPPECTLDNGCTVTFTALDPTDGSTVTGVTVSNASIYFDSQGSATDLAAGAFRPVLLRTQVAT
jgi:hypothetical protein